MKRIVIALGGNALGNDPVTQKEKTKLTALTLLPIFKENYEVVLTHGNGPQVGLINLAFDEGKKINDKVCSMPITECTAMSAGYIGYHLQNALLNSFISNGIKKNVSTIVTQIEVDKNDEAFKDPTKPIGSFYTKEEALKSGFIMKEDDHHRFRRVVPSPKPVKVLEEESIISLLNSGYVVISCGGGGIPVVNNDGVYTGIEAVIDKDFASSKLANDINADTLIILTAVDHAYINYLKEDEKKLENVTLEELIKYNNEGHFSKGSMKPKVEAAIDFLMGDKNRTAIITSIDNAYNAIKGISGTIIRG